MASGTKFPTLPKNVIAPTFYHLTPPHLVERAIGKVTAEPMWIFSERLSLSAKRFGSVPRVYIEATEDQAITLDLQRAMQSRLPCDVVMTLATDHSPFYSRPQDLAIALENVASRYAPDGN